MIILLIIVIDRISSIGYIDSASTLQPGVNMIKQKAPLSIITAVILGVAYPSMSSAQDQVQQGQTVEVVTVFDECDKKYGLQGLEEAPVDCVYELVSWEAQRLSDWVNKWQKTNLDHLKSAYPYYGIGIRFHYTKTEETYTYALYRPTILEVWVGSPADKAGLKPKDAIRRINDLVSLDAVASKDSNKDLEVDPSFLLDQINFVKATIANAKDPFSMGVERDGQVIDVEVSKTTIGQEVADVINRNLDRIESTNIAVRDMIGEIMGQMEASKDDKETLLRLYRQVVELDKYQDEPFWEILFVEAEKWQR